jgi:Glyoxalase/Bleomycin resistance protein/Dioxygenase superfamily
MSDSGPDTPRVGFYQVAYVTNDFERALRQCTLTHGAREFARMPAIQYEIGPGRAVVCNVGLAYVGATEIEVIEPLEGDVAVYRDALPTEGFALRFHHLARLYDTREEVEAQIAVYRREGRALPVDGTSPGSARYYYADFRAELGHYIEGVWFEPASRAWLGTIPRN